MSKILKAICYKNLHVPQVDQQASSGYSTQVLHTVPESKGYQATSTTTLHRPITKYMVPVHHEARVEDTVTAALEGQEAGPSGLSRPQSAISGSSVVAAAASDEDKGKVCISTIIVLYGTEKIM